MEWSTGAVGAAWVPLPEKRHKRAWKDPYCIESADRIHGIARIELIDGIKLVLRVVNEKGQRLLCVSEHISVPSSWKSSFEIVSRVGRL